ncbi:hypothetical protein BN1708_007182 [Verticillium longisporum]|uniref:Uncharacterized protein n=1 Tax=Verticillium longisporum TaxID=100787 RepID=A0A0G4MR35_VERLO|nr:hypothetical protein BN1708_007182 [Verticillium longisporum]
MLAPTYSSHLAAWWKHNVAGPVAGEVPGGVVAAGGLADRGVVDAQGDGDVAVVGELGAGREADLAAAVDGAAADLDVVAVLDEDGVVAVVGEVDVANGGAAGLGDAEDAAAAAARDDAVDVDVAGGVLADRVAAVAVGEAQGAVAGAGADVVAVDEADLRVGRRLDQEAGLAAVARDDLVDVEAVDVPRLDGVAAGARHADDVHAHVAVGRLVAVEPDAEAGAQVHGDAAEAEAAGAVEAETKVGAAGHGEVGDLHIVRVDRLNGATAAAARDVDGTAALEDLAAANGDGAGADAARGDDGDALARADRVDGGLDGRVVVGARVDGGAATGGREGAARAGDPGIRGAGAALSRDGRGQSKEARKDGELDHVCVWCGGEEEKRGGEGGGGDKVPV